MIFGAGCSVINGAMGSARAGPAACYVLSPVPLFLTPSATSLSSSAKKAGVLLVLRTLCAHPRRTNTIKTQQRAPVPIPRAQAVPGSVTGERLAKQLLPVCPASATTVISWNKAGMQPHVFEGLFQSHSSHCPLTRSSPSFFLRHADARCGYFYFQLSVKALIYVFSLPAHFVPYV